jgi:hypothetical protein
VPYRSVGQAKAALKRRHAQHHPPTRPYVLRPCGERVRIALHMLEDLESAEQII